MNYRSFTKNLSNLKQYYKDLEALNLRLDVILNDLENVKGLSYDQVTVHGNPSQIEQKRLEMIDEYNKLLEEKTAIDGMVQQVEGILARMPKDLSAMLKQVYIYGRSLKSLGEKLGYSDNGVWHYLKRETEKYL